MIRTMTAAALAATLAFSAGTALAGDAAAGKKVFNKCRACHKLEAGKKGVGSHLDGVVGRDIASVDGYKYSKGMQAFGGEHGAWTPELLTTYLANPKGVVKGTKMSFAGLKKDADIANVIAYLESLPSS